ncbi:hypothetical protein KAW08_02225 [bacterium]|nr:hypothetical protein [bacterium]
MYKIAVVGAGGHFTAPLVYDVISSRSMKGSLVVLEDPNKEKLERSKRICDMVVEKTKGEIHLKATTKLEEALDGADFVEASFRYGGELIGSERAITERYNIFSTVGDTIGAMGIFTSLRHIPVILGIAKEMERFCPNAWLINYSNPMAQLTRAVWKETNIKVVGLCHGVYGTEKNISKFLNIEKNKLQFKVVGVNHLPWFISIKKEGQDMYPLLKKKIEADEKIWIDLTWEYGKRLWPHSIAVQLFKTFGLFPSTGGLHNAEFFPWFCKQPQQKFLQNYFKETKWTKGTDRSKWSEEDWADDAIKTDYDDKAVSIMGSIIEGKTEKFEAVNLPNRGAVDNLPQEAVLEIPGIVKNGNLKPEKVGNIPQNIRGILEIIIASQEFTVEAAIKGDKKKLLLALLHDPLVSGNIGTIENARQLMEEILTTGKDYYPQFYK